MKKLILLGFYLLIIISCSKRNEMKDTFLPFVPPVSWEEADSLANSVLCQMTLDEKINMIGGHNMFYTAGIERLNLKPLLLSDATQGIRMLPHIQKIIEKSTAFPCPVALASTWNPDLAYQYAKSIGEECNAAGIDILLGPGVNIYRVSQNGRNFEYFGEDPFLGARLIEQYIKGVQETGTVATLKHFLCNNHEYHRRTTDVIVDERTLHEIYLPIFKAGIDAGAMAIMTAYNKVNGEYCGQSQYVITELLRNQLAFKWLVMSDWWSTFDPEKTILSGQDLEMPGHPIDGEIFKKLGDVYVRSNAKRLLNEGKIKESDIDRMVKSILRTAFAMKLYDKKPDTSYLSKFSEHVNVALNTAREAVVLLKNNQILPIKETVKSILLTGPNANQIAYGLGSAKVDGYDHVTLAQAMTQIFGNRLQIIEKPTDDEIKNAEIVVLNIGTSDSEGYDRPFELPSDIEQLIHKIADLNKNVVVIVNTGGGIHMSRWIDKIAALIYGWYPGQIGNVAIAEILSGKVNPSGKLPFTIEKEFSDSPGANYIPSGQTMEQDWSNDLNIWLPITRVEYKEGVLVGYRWYETKNIEPMFPFGFGLSYTTFQYNKIKCSGNYKADKPHIKLSVSLKNSGNIEGAEVVQVYIEDKETSVIRPKKELKAFRKVFLKPGQTQTIEFILDKNAFAYYDVNSKTWKVEPGKFLIHVGSSSKDIYLQKTITLN